MNIHLLIILQEENGSENENENDGDMLAPTGELSELERNLARIRVLLEQKYVNDRENCYSYVCANGYKLRLTPFMMREWAMAIVRLLVLFITHHLTLLFSMRPKLLSLTHPRRRHLIWHSVTLLAIDLSITQPFQTPAQKALLHRSPILQPSHKSSLHLLRSYDQTVLFQLHRLQPKPHSICLDDYPHR